MSTWILLRGLSRERRHWGTFPEALRKAMPQIRVITLDVPGNGALNDMPSCTTIDEMVAHCRAELLRYDVHPPYRLLGLSMGAMIATAWANRHPQEVKACVLINTSFASFSTIQQRLRPRAWPTLLKLALSLSAQHREELMFRLTSSRPQPPRRLIDEWVAIRESRPVSTLNTLRQLIAAARFRAPSAAPTHTLILASVRDDLVSPRCSREIARRWNCPIALHSVAGHDLPLDDSVWVAQQIALWLKNVEIETPALVRLSRRNAPEHRTSS